MNEHWSAGAINAPFTGCRRRGIRLTLALAGPVAAVKPVGGCPNEAFELMTYTEFRNLSLSLGVPEELLGPEHEAGWNAFDKNNDGMLCVMDLPDTPGDLGGWIFNVIDNTAAQG